MTPTRKIGFGTGFMLVVTSGFWLLALPFYRKRCPNCSSTNYTPLAQRNSEVDDLERNLAQTERELAQIERAAAQNREQIKQDEETIRKLEAIGAALKANPNPDNEQMAKHQRDMKIMLQKEAKRHPCEGKGKRD